MGNFFYVGASAEKATAAAELNDLPSIVTLGDRWAHDWHVLRAWSHAESGALLGMALAAVITILIVGGGIFFLHRLRSHFKPEKKRYLRNELFLVLAEPLLLLTGVIAFFAFVFPVLRSLPELYVFDLRIFLTLVTLIIAWSGLELISVFSRRMYIYAQRKDNNLDALMVDIFRKILKISLLSVIVVFICQSIFNLNITTLLAGAGVVGLAVAFASRETLSNFFGTLVIIWDNPFRCGDRVQIAGVDGLVTFIGMRSTRILTYNESEYTIPNSTIASANIENISNSGVIRLAFTVGLTYDTPPEKIVKAMSLLHNITDNFHGADQPEYIPRIFFDNLGNSAMNIKVIMWLKTASFIVEETWRTEINLAIIKTFNDENLIMAYNTVTNFVYGDPAHPIIVKPFQP